jgi:hypothetical protein
MPLMAVGVVAANLAVFWRRADRLSALTPERAGGYHAIVRVFALYFGGLTVLWSVAAMLGLLHVVGMPTAGSVMVRQDPTPFDWLFLLADAVVLFRLSVWLFAQDGAEVLVDHRQLFGSFPTSAGVVKILWALMLLVSLASLIYRLTT